MSGFSFRQGQQNARRWRRTGKPDVKGEMARTHLSLNKDAPIPRAVQAAGRILCRPILGGLHHQYGRI